MNLKLITSTFILYLFLSSACLAQSTDFSKASIYFSEKKNIQLQKAVQVLQEEIHKRTDILLPLTEKSTSKNKQIIVICTEGQINKLPSTLISALNKVPATGKDGYTIAFADDHSIIIAGHDERGALYGVGRLLRIMEMRPGQVLVPENINISSTPAYPIRGHQLGYRPKTNAYDAWSVIQFDSYIRDLAIFGANSIE